MKISDGIQFDTISCRVDLIKRRNFFFLRYCSSLARTNVSRRNVTFSIVSNQERKTKFEGTKENDGVGNGLSKKKERLILQFRLTYS